MDLINSKSLIVEEVNKIIESYQSNEKKHTQEMILFTKEVERLNQFNQKLLNEIREKDKIITTHEKTIHDYSIMINELQEKTIKELNEKEKFDMLKAQDKEIHNRDEEIRSLKKKIENLENSNTCDSNIEQVDNRWKDDPKNSYLDDLEKVKVAIKGYSKHTCFDNVTERDVGISSIGINGWYHDTIGDKVGSTLVEKMKEITKVQEEDIGEDIEEEVKEISEDKLEDESSEDELEVEIIKHYKKEYYIKTNEKDPQYIYAIDDGDIGDKVGEISGKKKIFYKK